MDLFLLKGKKKALKNLGKNRKAYTAISMNFRAILLHSALKRNLNYMTRLNSLRKIRIFKRIK